MKLFGVAVFFLIFLSAMTRSVYAQSSYVLPYPSSMPGSLSYKLHLLYENVSKYWYFGDFGQFDYNLKLSDKYLVEAKTLFEYRQYLLGYKALEKSDRYFINILPNLARAEKNGKNILQKRIIFNEAARKHIEILNRMQIDSPDVFNWQPEKALPTMLNIKNAIGNSVNVREDDI
ncbi:MAG: hypothetical protein Q8P29_01065 [Candidatus Levybacteria bacterium]|nr:hypothetical protein [Candidatus Levybacteria bacterium]